MTIETFLMVLLIVSTLTGLFTEALKKCFDECKRKYYSNLLAGATAVVLSLAIGIAYDAKRLQLRRTIADENNISVRTLYRYEKAFTEKQFAGLRPADREKHRSQSLPENFEYLLEQAIQLRKEVPERSVAKIIYILEAEGLVAPGVLKRSTLEQHIYKAGLWAEADADVQRGQE